MASVELRNVSKSFGSVDAVRDVSLTIGDRELVVFVGPSGCGKSTLLRMIAGLEKISSGELFIDGTLMNTINAADRGIAMVFQSYALYPHMTVAENMGFALKMLGVNKAEIDRKVAAAASILQLDGLLNRKPKELSGGQRQRVAIGRAITRNPDVFLFDEPLSNLDAGLRAQMRVEIARLHEQLRTTMIYVTHDQVEAMTLADRIVILNQGRIEQQGSPLELYERPANRFVASFLGQPKMNLLAVKVRPAGEGSALLLSGETALVTLPAMNLENGFLELGARPDEIVINDRPSARSFPGKIIVSENLGSTVLQHVSVKGVPDLVIVEDRSRAGRAAGAEVHLTLDPDRIHLFDEAGARLEPGAR